MKSVMTKDLFECKVPYLIPIFEKHEYPWNMLPEIGEYIKSLISSGLEDFCEIKKVFLWVRMWKLPIPLQ